MPAWINDPERINYFATTHTRGQHRAFGVRAKDRDKHFYVIGKSGMGKSTMLENMAIQDIQSGEGVVFIDPHGSTAEKLLDFIPEDRIKDTLYLAPFDTEFPLGFNILEDVGYDNRHKVVAGLMGVFERIWADSWSARMQYILQNTLFALLEYPGATIIDVNRMLVNKAFRADVVEYITDPIVASFWKEEFANYGDRYTQEATPAIQNKIGQFVSNPLIRNILGQPKSTFDLRKMMDERKIVIVNLSKGRMGEANAALLGSMLVIKVYLAALSRAEEPAHVMKTLPQCYFYVDEFQNVVNEAFENILSEARKYKLCLTIANQYIEQMPEEVRNAVFGNVGSTVIFRVGPMDAQFLEPVFAPTFIPEDMVGLGRGEIYLTLMIDGVGSAPFSAHTIPPIEEPGVSFREDIIKHTRAAYGRLRADVEKVIRDANEKWQEAAKSKHKEDSSKGPGQKGPGGVPRFGGGKPSFGNNDRPRRSDDRPPYRSDRSDRPSERPQERPMPPAEPMRESALSDGPRESREPASWTEDRHEPVPPAVRPPMPQQSAPPVAPRTERTAMQPARSPADLLRSTQQRPNHAPRTSVPASTAGPARPAERPQEKQERNALKAAIEAAKARAQAADTQKPAPAPAQAAPAPRPPVARPTHPSAAPAPARPQEGQHRQQERPQNRQGPQPVQPVRETPVPPVERAQEQRSDVRDTPARANTLASDDDVDPETVRRLLYGE
ncbi:MAG: type IV secretion system DNA-binding domain-containing protein [Candidatus Pacebacteria bacterium]|nr:type IV secretion system DNA-binding domain-containing protein [Candidatus Paceibacterota bacterium]